MKNKMLKELALNQNLCFNQVLETTDKIIISKSNNKVGSSKETQEICNIQSILEKYQNQYDIDIDISIDKVVIQNKR